MNPPVNTWYARITPAGPDGTVLLAVRSPDRPDGALGTLGAAEPPPTGCYLRAIADNTGRIQRLQPVGTQPTVPLWFVEIRDSATTPPAVHLVAFTGRGIAAGSVLDAAAASNTGADTTEQVGAIQFYPATGEVFQLFVAPAWRRRGVGSTLTGSAGCLAIARGWPRLWTDGQRTELGEAFLTDSPFAHRAAPRTHRLAPISP